MNAPQTQNAVRAVAAAPTATTTPAPIKAQDQQRVRPYDLREYAQRVASQAPPLTPQTRDRLAVLLRRAA